MNIYLVILLTLIAALFTSFSQILFKKGLHKKLHTIADIINTLRNRTILTGLSGYVVSFSLYLYVLKTSQLSVVFPIFGSTFIFVTLISAIHLKEKVNVIRIAGIIMIFLGIIVITITA